MLCLHCPHCGLDAEETEFAAGGEAHLKRMGPEADEDAFAGYLFERRNPRGVHFERWRHAFGCGKWFHVVRDTATLEIFASYRADIPEPPDDVLAAIRARRPDWEPSP